MMTARLALIIGGLMELDQEVKIIPAATVNPVHTTSS